MGGTIIETESEKIVKRAKAQMIIEIGQEDGLDNEAILKRVQEKTGVSLEKAAGYLKQFEKQLV